MLYVYLASCHDHERLTELIHRSIGVPPNFNEQLLKPKRGLWMTNAALVPLQQPVETEGIAKNKRRHQSQMARGTSRAQLDPKKFWAYLTYHSPLLFLTKFGYSNQKAEAGGPIAGVGFMSVLSWNYRSSGGPTVSTLNRYLRCMEAKLAFISETRCDERTAVGRICNLCINNHAVVPAQGLSGSLCCYGIGS